MTNVQEKPECIARHADLFQMGDREQQNAKKSIEAIILDVCTKDRSLQFEMKIWQTHRREHVRNAQETATDAKIQVLNRTRGFYAQGFGLVSQLGAAAAGGTATKFGAFCQVSSEIFNRSASSVEAFNNAESTQHDFTHQRATSWVQEQTQEIQGADSRHGQATSTIDRFIAQLRRVAELMTSSGS